MVWEMLLNQLEALEILNLLAVRLGKLYLNSYLAFPSALKHKKFPPIRKEQKTPSLVKNLQQKNRRTYLDVPRKSVMISKWVTTYL